MKKISIGSSSFEKIIKGNSYYVDKTLLIKEILDKREEAILIPRPRRFGKTLNMSMLKCFFEMRGKEGCLEGEGYKSLFYDLNIWKTEEKYRDEQGKYPVIYITFKDMKCATWEETYSAIKEVIIKEFNRHSYLLKSDKINDIEKEYYKDIISNNANKIRYEFSLLNLTEYLHKHYGVKPILLIDEYDIPIQQGYVKGFYTEVVEFTRNWLSGGLKDNYSLKQAVLTGILRVAQESIFSGLNNCSVYTLVAKRYREYFGFTQEEVRELAKYYNKEDKLQEIKNWYNGYNFGGLDIYNPWSVMNYFNAGCIPQSYWLSTSSNDIIHILLENSNDNMKDILKDFLNGKTYEAIINTNIVYPDINGDGDTLLSFLVLTGYLKAEDIQYEEGMCVGNLSIPNKEISIVYKKEILNQIKDFVSSKLVLNLRRAIMNGKGEIFSKLLNDLIYNSISYMDAHEDYYHGIMLGICALFSETHYLESNRESGEGRFDLMLEPKNNKYPAVIMEFKVADKKKISALKKKRI